MSYEKNQDNTALEKEVLDLLNAKIPEVDFADSDDLVGDGLLDSLTITNVIAEISLEYGLLIPLDEIREENFSSISAIAALVEKYRRT